MGTRGWAARGRVPQLDVCVPRAPQLPRALQDSSPGGVEAVLGAAPGSWQLSRRSLGQFPRPAALPAAGGCWMALGRGGDLGGRRGREAASAWERPPCGVPHGRDTRGGMCWRPGTALPAPGGSVDGCPGRASLGKLSPE